MSLQDLLATLSDDKNVKGLQFEKLCCWILQNAPPWQAEVKRTWLYDDWPGQWGPEAGVDVVAETHDGDLWAVQAKAYDSRYSLKKSDVDSFLTESNRAVFSYRLLIATTDKVGHTAQRTIDAQDKAKGVAVVRLADLEELPITWPKSFKRLKARQAKKKKPHDYQREAINKVVRAFEKKDRGQLLMACGTGKTFTSLQIVERMECRRTLVLVPSLILVSQLLRDWTADARKKMRFLPVCSSEKVRVDRHSDELLASPSQLGLPVTVDPERIARFLRRRGDHNRVVVSTYHSSPRIAEAFRLGRVPKFDLVLADEAHRLAGRISSDFATVLDAAQIRASKRLFMTATPRYFTERVKRRAEEVELEIASMEDDPEGPFGRVIHKLTFGESIKRELLTDYQVVVVNVSEDEVERLLSESGSTVEAEGLVGEMDPHLLASHIALAKAMKTYDMRRVLSFHSRISRAKNFSKAFPLVVRWLPKKTRPTGKLWSDFVRGNMPTDQRVAKLKRLRKIGRGERGLLSNARCLTEGVDVKSLDGVLFVDPKSSEVDIVQAVGRAIRKAEDKKLGTILLPVFVPDAEDPSEALRSSRYKHIWRVLRALRAHDEQLGEELDALRTGVRVEGRGRSQGRFKLRLPRAVGREFSEALRLRIVQQTTQRHYFSFEEAREYALQLGLRSAKEWLLYSSGQLPGHGPRPESLPSNPQVIYQDSGWSGWGDFLGTGNLAPGSRNWRPFEAARDFARSLGLQTVTQWRNYTKGDLPGLDELPPDIPVYPDQTYRNAGWRSYGDFLGTGRIANRRRTWLPFEEARKSVRALGLCSEQEWRKSRAEGRVPPGVPSDPAKIYAEAGWSGMQDWLGYETPSRKKDWRNFREVRTLARRLRLGSIAEWKLYWRANQRPDDVPSDPRRAYRGNGWTDWGDFLGTGNVAPGSRQWRPFLEARDYARALKLLSQREWVEYGKSGLRAADVPAKPHIVYRDDWVGWPNWLGTDSNPHRRRWRAFEQAREFSRGLGLRTSSDWDRYKATGERPQDIPATPNVVYRDEGWAGWADWLGAEDKPKPPRRTPKRKKAWRPFPEAREFARSLGLRSSKQWREFLAGKLDVPRPDDIPSRPDSIYRSTGWLNWSDWLGTRGNWRAFSEARAHVHSLSLETWQDWRKVCAGEDLPPDIPKTPSEVYQDSGWVSREDWLGPKARGRMPQRRSWRPFIEAREFVRALGLRSSSEWVAYSSGTSDRGKRPPDIPSNPSSVYREHGWLGMKDWLGTERKKRRPRKQWRAFTEAREFARTLGLSTWEEWRHYSAGRFPSKPPRPCDIPSRPNTAYRDKGWTSWADWLDARGKSNPRKNWRPFKEARAFVQALGLSGKGEWAKFSTGRLRTARPPDIPAAPDRTYAGQGWAGWKDWLGNKDRRKGKTAWRRFQDARRFARGLRLRSKTEWEKACREGGKIKRPKDIPYDPRAAYKDQGWKGWKDWLGTA